LIPNSFHNTRFSKIFEKKTLVIVNFIFSISQLNLFLLISFSLNCCFDLFTSFFLVQRVQTKNWNSILSGPFKKAVRILIWKIKKRVQFEIYYSVYLSLFLTRNEWTSVFLDIRNIKLDFQQHSDKFKLQFICVQNNLWVDIKENIKKKCVLLL
jgi:hypothetical protein